MNDYHMAGNVLIEALHIFFYLIFFFILQRSMELGKIKWLTRGHIAGKWQRQVCVTLKLTFLITRLLAYSRHAGTACTFKRVNIKLELLLRHRPLPFLKAGTASSLSLSSWT